MNRIKNITSDGHYSLDHKVSGNAVTGSMVDISGNLGEATLSIVYVDSEGNSQTMQSNVQPGMSLTLQHGWQVTPLLHVEGSSGTELQATTKVLTNSTATYAVSQSSSPTVQPSTTIALEIEENYDIYAHPGSEEIVFLTNKAEVNRFIIPFFSTIEPDETLVFKLNTAGNYEPFLQFPISEYDHRSLNEDFNFSDYEGDLQAMTLSNSIGGVIVVTYGTANIPLTLTLTDGQTETFIFNGVTGWQLLSPAPIVASESVRTISDWNVELTEGRVIANSNNGVISNSPSGFGDFARGKIEVIQTYVIQTMYDRTEANAGRFAKRVIINGQILNANNGDNGWRVFG